MRDVKAVLRAEGLTLSGMVADQAMTRPDAPAIVDVSRTWTWAETSEAVGRASRALVDCGVVAGDRVGVHFNKCAEGFVAMHAVVSIGAVAVPLDPASPAVRLASICERMQIDVVISHPARGRSLGELHEKHPIGCVVGAAIETDPSIRCVDESEMRAVEPLSPLSVDVDAASYIITTSGSTGEPKGIVHTHASAMAYASMARRAFDVGPADRVADIAPHHFDISTFSLWTVPLSGATNVVISEPYQRLPASHSQRLEDEAVTLWYSVPFLLQQLVLRGDLENRDLSALRWVHFGGEVISPQVIATFMRFAPSARFANIFGPAESNQSTLHVFDGPPDPSAMLPIGHVVDGTEIRIVDPARDTPDLAHLASTGEIWTASAQLMQGYWDQPELNSRVLVELDGKRWYRSGDLASVDSDGMMTFHGRIDHQVKVRGYRIELEGIEMELEQLEGVDHVVVAVDRSPSGEDELIAGLLGATNDFDEQEFLAKAASVLPAYAVPTRTVNIATAAFTGSGKLDRRTLREGMVGPTADNAQKETTS